VAVIVFLKLKAVAVTSNLFASFRVGVLPRTSLIPEPVTAVVKEWNAKVNCSLSVTAAAKVTFIE
jgi:hypothetical protein